MAGRQCLSPTPDEGGNVGTLHGQSCEPGPGGRQRPLLAARPHDAPFRRQRSVALPSPRRPGGSSRSGARRDGWIRGATGGRKAFLIGERALRAIRYGAHSSIVARRRLQRREGYIRQVMRHLDTVALPCAYAPSFHGIRQFANLRCPRWPWRLRIASINSIGTNSYGARSRGCQPVPPASHSEKRGARRDRARKRP